MTTRTKTIEYATTTDISLLAASNLVTKTIDIDIPETSPTFRSCVLQAYATKEVDTNSFNSPLLGISTDGVTWDDVTLPDPIPTSAESEYWTFRRDVTSYFTANFDGATPPTSVTWSVRFSSGDNSGNHAFKLLITYDYDDTETTQIKTIKIPITSSNAYLGTSFGAIGGTTPIPAIGGSYLPESSVVIRQAWIELMGAGAGTAARELYMRVNGGTTVHWGSYDVNGNEPQWPYGQVDVTAEDLTAARSLEAYCSVASSTSNLGGLLCVTYEFDESASTTIHNSVMVPVSGSGIGGFDDDGVTEAIKLLIQEPATITLRESAVVTHSTSTLELGVGSQTDTVYNLVDTSSTGMSTVVHRFDSGSLPQGSWGGTLARGSNTISVHVEPNNTSRYDSIFSYGILNYTSGKATAGAGAHNHTVGLHLQNSIQSTSPVAALVIGFAEAEYYLSGIMFEVFIEMDNITTTATRVSIERLVAEGRAGWITIPLVASKQFGENQTWQLYTDITKYFQQWPDQVNTDQLLVPKVSRRYAVVNYGSSYWAAAQHMTYHSIPSDADIVVTNYTGDGSGIAYSLISEDDGEIIFNGTTSTGGTATATVYDDTLTYRAVAQQGVRSGASLAGGL